MTAFRAANFALKTFFFNRLITKKSRSPERGSATGISVSNRKSVSAGLGRNDPLLCVQFVDILFECDLLGFFGQVRLRRS